MKNLNRNLVVFSSMLMCITILMPCDVYGETLDKAYSGVVSKAEIKSAKIQMKHEIKAAQQHESKRIMRKKLGELSNLPSKMKRKLKEKVAELSTKARMSIKKSMEQRRQRLIAQKEGKRMRDENLAKLHSELRKLDGATTSFKGNPIIVDFNGKNFGKEAARLLRVLEHERVEGVVGLIYEKDYKTSGSYIKAEKWDVIKAHEICLVEIGTDYSGYFEDLSRYATHYEVEYCSPRGEK